MFWFVGCMFKTDLCVIIRLAFVGHFKLLYVVWVWVLLVVLWFGCVVAFCGCDFICIIVLWLIDGDCLLGVLYLLIWVFAGFSFGFVGLFRFVVILVGWWVGDFGIWFPVYFVCLFDFRLDYLMVLVVACLLFYFTY